MPAECPVAAVAIGNGPPVEYFRMVQMEEIPRLKYTRYLCQKGTLFGEVNNIKLIVKITGFILLMEPPFYTEQTTNHLLVDELTFNHLLK